MNVFFLFIVFSNVFTEYIPLSTIKREERAYVSVSNVHEKGGRYRSRNQWILLEGKRIV